jgi:hypothetical protein
VLAWDEERGWSRVRAARKDGNNLEDHRYKTIVSLENVPLQKETFLHEDRAWHERLFFET